MLPVDIEHTWVRRDIGICLLHLPIVEKAIVLVVQLRGTIIIGSIAGIMIFNEGDSFVFPRNPVRAVADHTDPVTESVQRTVDAFIILESEIGAEVEDTA